MNTASIAIVGAGLSGLYAAFLLERQGISDYVVFEAREQAGGRIAHFEATEDRRDRFDLGPAWFWPDYQPQLDALVRELGLARFAQHESGDMMVERGPAEAPMRVRGFVNAPPSVRLLGGMGTLVEALCGQVDSARILTGQTVLRLRRVDRHVELDCQDRAGADTTWRAAQVLLALPPRVVEHGIAFLPALPADLAHWWRATPTWMAPHAKYIAVYDQPFWRELGLSGEARSVRGPLGEIHDASMPGGSAALFGFFGMHAQFRHRMPDHQLRSLCRAQVARLFGPRAGAPRADIINDWALDSFTSTDLDLREAGASREPPLAIATCGPWSECLTGIGSEWSPQFPGYVAGAIDAAARGVDVLLSRTDSF